METRAYQALICPRCGAAPEPGAARCRGCGRAIAAAGGGLDLLDDDERLAADGFARLYAALRRREGWAGADGREDPQGGEPKLWRGRMESVSEAAGVLSTAWKGGGRQVVLDVGSGGGWAARYLGHADVIAIDLLDVPTQAGVLHVRGDMRRLPVRDSSVDAALYAASLHYSPLSESIREAARVLAPGGLLVAVDSPIYEGRRSQARAEERSKAYYAAAGFPELGRHYHPIDVTELRACLAAAGFDVLRFDTGRSSQRWWSRLGRPGRSSFLIAKLVRLETPYA
ncbi:MAG TPA: class I SAM-dependent methyltransferase [Candidatus Dormibacteraeota bacterium]|nr:class I SAM-dependent methyltransferase [Candidatus Dormibacteraeota bacterium]